MSALTVVSVADRAGFHIFAAALRNSEHLKKLESAGPYTVFAPSDAAFHKLPPGAFDTLQKRDAMLFNLVLGYHFARGQVISTRFSGKRIRAVMQAGGDVMIDGRTGLRVNTANLVKPDLNAGNGVVHGIDAVLWPRQVAAAVGAA